ncbi:MAG: hydroxyacylglutathione hydrolase [Candidatus Berkiellales bacterium]
MNKIVALLAFKDNYIWAIHSLEGSEIVVIDPGDAKPVLQYLKECKLTLSAILITHHHWDHSGGILKLRQHFPDITVYGSKNEKINGVNHPVQEGDKISLPAFDLTMRVLDIPGHTLGHVAYVSDKPALLFCGDTLFSCGCGRVFEGTPEQMVHSLNKLKQLPPQTLMYCGHEYTLANIAFAQLIEPHNKMLMKRLDQVKELRAQGLPSLPVTMAEEQQTNPFLRCDQPDVITAAQNYRDTQDNSAQNYRDTQDKNPRQNYQDSHHSDPAHSDPITIFTLLRQWKNQL